MYNVNYLYKKPSQVSKKILRNKDTVLEKEYCSCQPKRNEKRHRKIIEYIYIYRINRFLDKNKISF